jgi:hypothetical protein
LIEEGEVLFLQVKLSRRSDLLEECPISLTEPQIETRQVVIGAHH